MFVCNNGRCINKKLVCDGYDHCGDNYDETHGCSYGGKSTNFCQVKSIGQHNEQCRA